MAENPMANDQDQLSESELEAVAGGVLDTITEGLEDAPDELPIQNPADAPDELPIQNPADAPDDLPIEGPEESIGDLPIEGPEESIGELPIQNPAEDDSVPSSEGSDVFTDAPESPSTPPESPPPEAPPAGPFDDVIGEIDDMINEFPAPPAGEPPV